MSETAKHSSAISLGGGGDRPVRFSIRRNRWRTVLGWQKSRSAAAFTDRSLCGHARNVSNSTPIAAGAFEPDSAERTDANGDADLIAFVSYFISNPELPRHIRDNLPLSPYDRSINAATTGAFFAISAASTARLLWGISHPSRR